MIAVIGANGFLGKAVASRLKQKGEKGIYYTRNEFDLLGSKIPSAPVAPSCVIYCADYYPGLAYTAEHPEEVYSANVRMFDTLLSFAEKNRAKRVITIGTTCCYPIIDEPLHESLLEKRDYAQLNQKLRGYALSRFTLLDMAKTRGICHHHLILPNFYGPGDRFEEGKSHLLSSWIRDFHCIQKSGKRSIVLWGSPEVKREFIYIDDAAVYVLELAEENIHREVLNVGCGLCPTYGEVAKEILQALNFKDYELEWDGKINKNVRKVEVMNLSELDRYAKLLPRPRSFAKGIHQTVSWYLKSLT